MKFCVKICGFWLMVSKVSKVDFLTQKISIFHIDDQVYNCRAILDNFFKEYFTLLSLLTLHSLLMCIVSSRNGWFSVWYMVRLLILLFSLTTCCPIKHVSCYCPKSGIVVIGLSLCNMFCCKYMFDNSQEWAGFCPFTHGQFRAI